MITEKYTIVTTTRNRQQYLELCKQYIEHQTIQSKEWIIVDSSKESNIIESKNIKYIHLDSNLPYTITKGIEIALTYVSTDKIFIFDDDDFYAPNYVETMLPYLSQHDLVGLRTIFIYNIKYQKYIYLTHKQHCTFACTAFKSNTISTVLETCKNTAKSYIDFDLWRNINNKIMIPESNIFTAIKGLPDTIGMTTMHSKKGVIKWKQDYNYSKLGRKIIYYKSILRGNNADKRVTK